VQEHREWALRQIDPGVQIPRFRVSNSMLKQDGMVDLVLEDLNILKAIAAGGDGDRFLLVVGEAFAGTVCKCVGRLVIRDCVENTRVITDAADQQ